MLRIAHGLQNVVNVDHTVAINMLQLCMIGTSFPNLWVLGALVMRSLWKALHAQRKLAKLATPMTSWYGELLTAEMHLST